MMAMIEGGRKLSRDPSKSRGPAAPAPARPTNSPTWEGYSHVHVLELICCWMMYVGDFQRASESGVASRIANSEPD